MADGIFVGINEAKLWNMADALRNNMDAAEYKHVVLGLIFLKYISDAFEAKHAELEAQRDQGADPEDPDEYRAASIFWVPKEARWAHLKDSAPQPKIGTIVDEAMTAIERDNPSLKSVLARDYSRPGLDKQRLGQLINLVSDIGLGSPADRAKDVLGRVYEYFLAQFASAEGKKGGQFYTPDVLESQLLEKLQRDVLAPAAIEYVFRRLELELGKQLNRIDSNLETMRRRKAQLEAELENLTRAVAGGLDSASIRKGIAEREAEISTLAARVLGRTKDSVGTQIRDLRKFVLASVGDFRALISANDNAAATRMELAKHVKEIELLPGDGGTIKYKGQWALLGDGDLLRSWDGAEGQNRTGYAGLFRAALYR